MFPMGDEAQSYEFSCRRRRTPDGQHSTLTFGKEHQQPPCAMVWYGMVWRVVQCRVVVVVGKRSEGQKNRLEVLKYPLCLGVGWLAISGPKGWGSLEESLARSSDLPGLDSSVECLGIPARLCCR